MPELPEVEALARFVSEQATGLEIERVRVGSLSALKTFDPPVEALEGRTVTGATRRGKHLCVDTGGLWLVTHLSRSGWLRWSAAMSPAPVKPGKGPLALRVRFTDASGFDLTEAATEKRLAVWIVASLDDVEGIARLGPDPLDLAFDVDALAEVLAGRKQQLKGVLTDQSAIAGIGNAYSDEVLHAARLSPFKQAASLGSDEVAALHAAIKELLADAVERSKGLPAAGLKQEKRSGMRVHGRTGEACPVCGDTVREVSFATSALQYCATCQTGGKPLADRRLSRLLK